MKVDSSFLEQFRQGARAAVSWGRETLLFLLTTTWDQWIHNVVSKAAAEGDNCASNGWKAFLIAWPFSDCDLALCKNDFWLAITDSNFGNNFGVRTCWGKSLKNNLINPAKTWLSYFLKSGCTSSSYSLTNWPRLNKTFSFFCLFFRFFSSSFRSFFEEMLLASEFWVDAEEMELWTWNLLGLWRGRCYELSNLSFS